MVTIYDVARRAGVSAATVSRVFNGVGVSEAKVLAVREAAAELRYTPSRTARTLRTQSSEVIALLIPDIENPYFTELARGVEDVASGAGYSVVLCNTDSDAAKEATYLGIALAENMAGIVVAPASAQTDLAGLLALGRPVVTVDRAASQPVDHVVMDNERAGYLATEALLAAGYRRIACLSGPRVIETARERAAGWHRAMTALLPSVDLEVLDLDELVCSSSFQVNGGRAGMQALLARAHPPDAVVAGNNLLGVGALQVLAERGLTPPVVGVAVVGSLPFTTLSPGAVTVVRLPAREMGERAARMLLDRLAGDSRSVRTEVLPGVLHPAVLGRPSA